MRPGRGRRLAVRLAISGVAAVGCGDAPEAAPTLGSLGAGVARVEVVWRDASGAERSRPFGTAFRIGPHGELLTAQHVAANARGERKRLGPKTGARIRVSFGNARPGAGGDGNAFPPVEVAIAAEDRDADLALLRILARTPESDEGDAAEAPASGIAEVGGARLASVPPPADSAVAVVGYPIGEPDLVVRTGRLLDAAALRRERTDSDSLPPWLESLLRDRTVLLASVETRLGNSGAPIYLAETGEIVGLCSAILYRNEIRRDELIPLPHRPGDAITVIIAAHRIQSFLDAHRASTR